MISYSYKYRHDTKEVMITLQVGMTPPMSALMSAEAFIQDMEFMANDQKLAHFLSIVRKRKDLPIDYDFGAEAEIKFEPKEWEGRMQEGTDEAQM